uniref:Alpha-1,3-mannosyl-glycoprotein 2-beta-N-acetylglucosaminyltransferase n=1 Tax=Tetraselmis chuii TaxID=63592 RepID=A0A7S1SHF8_9CHLO
MERELQYRRKDIEGRVSNRQQMLGDSFMNAHPQAGSGAGSGTGVQGSGQAGGSGAQGNANSDAVVGAVASRAAEVLRQSFESHGVQQPPAGSLPQEIKPAAVTERIFPPSNEDRGCPVLADPTASRVTAGVVVVAFNRPDYLQRTLNSILAARKLKPEFATDFPLYVSQDGSFPGVKEVVVRHTADFAYMNHIETKAPQPLTPKENLAYYRISNHYKFILGVMFDCLQYKKAIILEDDMQLSIDFFEYFKATAPLLDEDKTLYAVSSWNDHGQSQFVANSSQLYRSDFFPGLGWMLTKELWEELKPKWPRAYWDDWMRQTQHRKGRQSIRPEVCRTFNFGEKGTSRGQFYKKYLATIHLNAEYVPFRQHRLDYLLQHKYEPEWDALLATARAMSVEDAMKASGDVKVIYNSQESYEAITGKLGMLREWKDGVPRGAYKGVVPVRFNKARIFIAPAEGFKPEERITGKVDASGALVKQ